MMDKAVYFNYMTSDMYLCMYFNEKDEVNDLVDDKMPDLPGN